MTENKVRILVVGVGSIGERHVRCYRATGRTVVGVCEAHDERRNNVAARYDLCGAWSSLNEALVQSWDAVLIATPAHTHIPLALQVARAGFRLIIEKPLATSLDGVEELLSEVESRNLTCAVSYQYRAHPGVCAIKAALDLGRFGRPRQIYGMIAQHFPHYRPAYREVYFADRAQGGGAVQDAITHLLNLGEFLVGPINRLTVDAAHQQLDGVTVEDTVHVLTRQGDVMGAYALNLYQHPNESQVTVVCEGGTVRFELLKGRWRTMTEPEGTWEDHPCVLADRDAWYVANANAILDALAGRRPAPCTLRDGVQTLRVNLAALTSMETGAWQEISQT